MQKQEFLQQSLPLMDNASAVGVDAKSGVWIASRFC